MTVTDRNGRPIQVGNLVIQSAWDSGRGAILALADTRGIVADLGRSRAGVSFDLESGPVRRVHGSCLEVVTCKDCQNPATHYARPASAARRRPVYLCGEHATKEAQPLPRPRVTG